MIDELDSDDPYRAELIEARTQLLKVANIAYRTRTVNAALGTHLDPDAIDLLWPDETIELLILWATHQQGQ